MYKKTIIAVAACVLAACPPMKAFDLPYPIYPEGRAVSFDLTRDGESFGQASLGWTPKVLIVEARVLDATPTTLEDAGVAISEAYRADSIEFWVGRRWQFVAALTPEGGRLWDYTLAHEVPGAKVTHEYVEGGYAMRIEVPWKSLEIDPDSGASFPFALQINDRQRVLDGERWKDSGRLVLFPQQASWGRESTYGIVFLSESVAGGITAPEPLPLASLDIRQYAYAQKVEAVIDRRPGFEGASLVLVCRDADGEAFAEIPVPKLAKSSESAAILLQLPWREDVSGIFRAELYLERDGVRYGPSVEPYFNGGPTAIAEYRSPRKAPEDLLAFWDGKIAAMRARPMNAIIETLASERPGIVIEKVRLDNHRGNPMTVFVSRHAAAEGRHSAYLNVYPPMRAGKAERPQSGVLGLTFCGSLQGDNRLPGQENDEGLWARAENLDESYWLDVVLDGVRAMDYVATRPDSNGRTIVSGGSRGGWYAFALAAVAPDRVALARFTSPCYSDVTMNQQLGYTSAASEIYLAFERDRVKTDGKVFANFRYFDPLFLAELIRTPVVFSAGLQDSVTSAIGMTAAANRIAPEFRTFILDAEGGHGGSPWMRGISQMAEELVQKKQKNRAGKWQAEQ
jgi:cephalosporin-C deacetylase-like acetyl esterase